MVAGVKGAGFRVAMEWTHSTGSGIASEGKVFAMTRMEEGYRGKGDQSPDLDSIKMHHAS